MEKRMYRVSVTVPRFDVVVYAEDAVSASRLASESWMEASGDFPIVPAFSCAERVLSVYDLRLPWDADCIPYGCGDDDDRSIKMHLEDENEE